MLVRGRENSALVFFFSPSRSLSHTTAPLLSPIPTVPQLVGNVFYCMLLMRYGASYCLVGATCCAALIGHFGTVSRTPPRLCSAVNESSTWTSNVSSAFPALFYAACVLLLLDSVSVVLSVQVGDHPYALFSQVISLDDDATIVDSWWKMIAYIARILARSLWSLSVTAVGTCL